METDMTNPIIDALLNQHLRFRGEISYVKALSPEGKVEWPMTIRALKCALQDALPELRAQEENFRADLATNGRLSALDYHNRDKVTEYLSLAAECGVKEIPPGLASKSVHGLQTYRQILDEGAETLGKKVRHEYSISRIADELQDIVDTVEPAYMAPLTEYHERAIRMAMSFDCYSEDEISILKKFRLGLHNSEHFEGLKTIPDRIRSHFGLNEIEVKTMRDAFSG